MDLKGKTIKDYHTVKMKNVNDEPFIRIDFTDGTQIIFESTYGGYTGGSIDEYPMYAIIKEEFSEYDKIYIADEELK